MAKLILEEAGETRRFRLNEGKLTIGSGERATLKLASEAVADVHAELEWQGGTATLRVRKGVTPVRTEGRAVQGELTLVDGVPVEIGGAKLWIELEGKEKETLVARRERVSKAEVARGRGATTGPASPSVRRTRSRATKSSGLPIYMLLPLLLLAAYAGYRYFSAVTTGTAQGAFDEQSIYLRARASLDEGDTKGAQKELDKLVGQELSEAWAAKFEPIATELAEARAIGELRAHNTRGNQTLQTQLKNFESRLNVKGELVPARVRVFLKRAAEFKEEWPQHPELEWLDRKVERYSKVVDISAPPTYDDIAYETETLTWARPRRYKQSFAIIEKFMETASYGDKQKAVALVDQLAKAREDYFEDRLLQARYEYHNKDDIAQSMEELVQLVEHIGDPGMENEAAKRLLALDDVDKRLANYKQFRARSFAALAENELIRAKLQALDLL